MARTQKLIKAVEKAYGSKILLNHSRWAKDPDPSKVNKDRFCVECAKVLTTGYDPNELDVAAHQYEALIEAGMRWIISPADIPDVSRETSEAES